MTRFTGDHWYDWGSLGMNGITRDDWDDKG